MQAGVFAVFAKTPIESNAIYTREETAHLLGISLSTLKHLIRTGQLKVSQPVGLRRVFIRGTSILEMLDSSERDVRWLDEKRLKFLDTNSQEKIIRPKQISARTRTYDKKSLRAPGGVNR